MVREIAVEAFLWREVGRSSSPEALERGKRLKGEIDNSRSLLTLRPTRRQLSLIPFDYTSSHMK